MVDEELRKQVADGHYVVASERPAIISPLAAIPKDDTSVRLIHDGSRPRGQAMNDYTDHHSVRYQSIQDACKIAKPGYFCAKLDLKNAYRSLAIHPDDYKATGIAWEFEKDVETFLFDTRLCFGSKLGPHIFSRTSNAIRRIMIREGFQGIVCYLDDFFLAFPTYDECESALFFLIKLVRRLGFNVSWKKVVSPSTHVAFLGIDIDTVDCSLSLGSEKLHALHEKLKLFKNRARASLKQLQSLAGSLNWACQVTRGGRFFLRRILDTMGQLKHARHKAKLGLEFRKDLSWWLTFLHSFNGRLYFREASDVHVSIDACQSAAGAFCAGDWVYSTFRGDWPLMASKHINYKEVCAVICAVNRWAPMWRNRAVVVHTDSTVAKAVINKGRSKDTYVNELLRAMCWLSIKYNFELRAIHVPGAINLIPDTISRLHERGNLDYLALLLTRWHHNRPPPLHLAAHMSDASLRFLCEQVHRNWRQSYRVKQPVTGVPRSQRTLNGPISLS